MSKSQRITITGTMKRKMENKKKLFAKAISLVLILAMVVLWPLNSRIKEVQAITALPTLRPVTPDGTITNVVDAGDGATNLYASIDDDPDTPDTGDYINNDGAAGSVFLNLTDMPADFSSMATLDIDFYLNAPAFFSDDTAILTGQVFQSDETTTLTSQEQLAIQTTTAGFYSVSFTTVTGSDKTTWDGAVLKLDWAYTQNKGPDGGEIYVAAAELDGTYNEVVLAPTFTLNSYRWYVDSDAEDVTEPWGDPDIAQDTAITATPVSNDPPSTTQELRLRVNFTVNTTDLPASDTAFKLQFKKQTSIDCTGSGWTDVGTSQDWDFATSTVTDGTDLTVSRLSPVSNVLEEYIKSNPTGTNPNSATTGQEIEYDFHIVGTSASSASQYTFRVIESDGTVFDSYTNCPTLETEPGTGDLLRHGNIFVGGSEKGFWWAD